MTDSLRPPPPMLATVPALAEYLRQETAMTDHDHESTTTPGQPPPPSAPILSWCLIHRNQWEYLRACLTSLRQRTPDAEIVVVDTCSSTPCPDDVRALIDVYETYRGPRGDWDEQMPWFDDAAAARQRSFDLASGRWRGWVDADDVIPGPDEAERYLRLNRQWQPKRVLQRVDDLGRNGESTEPIYLTEILSLIETRAPEVTCIWAPYLYQRDEHGEAIVWQDRERIVLWSDPPKYRWSEAAHEILVPVGEYRPPRFDLAHLLFLHEKKFDDASFDYATARHFKVISDQVARGEGTTRRFLYLAAYAPRLAPAREEEFLQCAHAHATTTLDRMQACIAIGRYMMARGRYHDAMEHFAAGQAMESTLPDAYLAAGIAASSIKDHARAAAMLGVGVALEVGPGSEIAPRHHAVRYPTLLGMELQALAASQVQLGLHDRAANNYRAAAEHARRVLENPDIGHDRFEAENRYLAADNLASGHEQAMAIHRLWRYLKDNDESLKACAVLEAVPHTIADHPLVIEIENWARGIRRHVADPAAYVAFYNDDVVTGYVDVDPESMHEPRRAWIGDWIAKHAPTARVLDFGCCNGIVGIPLLTQCRQIDYVGLDINPVALGDFRGRLAARDFADELKVTLVPLPFAFPEQDAAAEALGGVVPLADGFDVVLWTEVIEHVPDPVASLRSIRGLVRPGGVLFVSTPYGSYDAGHPPPETSTGGPRDSRGHVRVYLPDSLCRDLRDAGFEVIDLRNGTPGQLRGAPLHALARPMADDARSKFEETAVRFVVPSALWDWNASTALSQGMGASETQIVRIAGALADDRFSTVYGPVPAPEVHDRVPYWPLAHLRHERVDDSLPSDPTGGSPDGTFVVSRAPGYATTLRERVGGDPDLILWLQDTHYPDLTAEVAAMYRKIVCVSEWHKRLICEAVPELPADKVAVIHNAVEPSLYNWADPPPRRRHHMVWCSSPDRGINRLLTLWPRILAHVPSATLDIYYGWRGCAILGAGSQTSWSDRFQTMRAEYDQLRHQPGIVERGMVPPAQLARELMTASVWPYHTNFHETCCTAALEVRAAGCVPVTSALAALCETAACEQGHLIDPSADDYDDQFLEAVLAAMETSDAERARMAERALDEHALARRLPLWKEILA